MEENFRRMIFMITVFIFHVLNSADAMNKFLQHLPTYIKPEKYDVTLFFDIWDNIPHYWGTVKIMVHCHRNTNKIVLHQYELNIDKNSIMVRLVKDGKTTNTGVEVENPSKGDECQYIINLGEELVEGKMYEVKMKFSSKFSSSNAGFIIHRNSQQFKQDMVAFTYINEIDARYVIPCFDQLDMKAKYKIRLKHDPNLKTLSNAKFISSKRDSKQPQWYLDDFEETPPMGTFSLAIAVLQNFKSKKAFTSSSRIEIRVWAHKSLIGKLNNLEQIVSQIFDFYLTLFSLPYVLQKLDVVIPDNVIHLKESYGMIFMSEMDALKIGKESRDKYEMLSKISNAISKQWMGHMVTVSNWLENYFYDGLNHLFQILCLDEVFPQYKNAFTELDIINSFIQLLNIEAQVKSTAIATLEYNNWFRIRSYNLETKNKVNQLVRMMRFFLGPVTFRKCINVYLKRYKDGNSNLSDMWEIFTDIAKTEEVNSIFETYKIEKILNSWKDQRGYPVVTVTRNYDNNYTAMKLTQEPFALTDKEKRGEKKRSWIVPLSYATKKKPNFENIPAVRVWLTTNSPTLVIIPEVDKHDWIIFNLNMNVLARVTYDEHNWSFIQKALDAENHSGIEALTRVQLILDMFALIKIEKLTYTFVLNTMQYLKREKFYAAWSTALMEFNKMRKYLLNSPVLKPFEEYVRDILTPILQEENYKKIIEFSSENEMQNLFNSLFLETSCNFGMNVCRETTKLFIQRWKDNPETEWSNTIPEKINEIIHCQAVKFEDTTYWDELWKQYHNNNTPEDIKDIILKALGCSTDTKTLTKYLERSINRKSYNLSNNDSTEVFKSLSSNEKGYKLMHKFFQNKFKSINTYPKDEGYNNYFAISYLNILLQITKKKEDLDLLKNGPASKLFSYESVQQRLEIAEENILWLLQYEKTLMEYFQMK